MLARAAHYNKSVIRTQRDGIIQKNNRLFRNCCRLGYHAASIGDNTDERSSHLIRSGSLKFNKLLTSIKSFISKSKLARHIVFSAHNEDKAVPPTYQYPTSKRHYVTF